MRPSIGPQGLPEGYPGTGWSGRNRTIGPLPRRRFVL